MPPFALSIHQADSIDLDRMLTFIPTICTHVYVGYRKIERTTALLIDGEGTLIAPLRCEERICFTGGTPQGEKPYKPCQVTPGQHLAALILQDSFVSSLLWRFVHQYPPKKQCWSLLVSRTVQYALTAPAGFQWRTQTCPNCEHVNEAQQLPFPEDASWVACSLGNVAEQCDDILTRCRILTTSSQDGDHDEDNRKSQS